MDGHIYGQNSWLYFSAAQPDRREALENVLAGLCKLMHDISKEKFGVPIVVRQEIVAL